MKLVLSRQFLVSTNMYIFSYFNDISPFFMAPKLPILISSFAFARVSSLIFINLFVSVAKFVTFLVEWSLFCVFYFLFLLCLFSSFSIHSYPFLYMYSPSMFLFWVTWFSIHGLLVSWCFNFHQNSISIFLVIPSQ